MHHTKEKGDLGLAVIIADLSRKGLKILLPLSEHLPFDLVAFDSDTHKMYRVQCKHRKMLKGVVTVSLTTSYASAKGSVATRYAVDSFDVMAVYCPDTEAIYYVPQEKLIGYTSSFKLRVEPISPKARANMQYNKAEEFLAFPL